MNHKLGIAHRCQLLTGSFEGNEQGCTCLSFGDCKLTEEEREYYKTVPSVQATAKLQLEKFNKLKEKE